MQIRLYTLLLVHCGPLCTQDVPHPREGVQRPASLGTAPTGPAAGGGEGGGADASSVNMADASGQVYASSDSREDSNSEDSTKQQPGNIFRNDGSFMEMFKKLQEDQKKREDEPKPALKESPSVAAADDRASPHSSAKELPKKTSLSFVGKRRGGRILATGMVKKQRKEAESEKQPDGGKTDAWSQYMNEVRKYKEQSCEEEGKRRPLVK